MNLCVEECCSMHLSDLFCTCNPLFAIHTSDSTNPPSWSVCRECTNLDLSNLTGRFPPPFLLIRSKLLKNCPFAWKTSSSTFCVVASDLTLVLLESSSALVPLEEELGNLLLKSRVDLLSVVSKLGEIPLSSLLGHIFCFEIFCLENNFLSPCFSSLEVKFCCCYERVSFFWNNMYLPM